MSSIVQQKTATYCLSVPLIVHYFFSPMIIFVANFSAPIGASVFNIFGTPSGRLSELCNKNQPHIVYQSLYLLFFLSLQ